MSAQRNGYRATRRRWIAVQNDDGFMREGGARHGAGYSVLVWLSRGRERVDPGSWVRGGMRTVGSLLEVSVLEVSVPDVVASAGLLMSLVTGARVLVIV